MQYVKNKIKFVKSKLAQIGNKINNVVGIVIFVVVIFQIFSSLVPEAQSAGEQLNSSNRCAELGCFFGDGINGTQDGCFNNQSVEQENCAVNNEIPLSSLFSSRGVVILLLMVGLFIMVIRLVMPKGKK